MYSGTGVRKTPKGPRKFKVLKGLPEAFMDKSLYYLEETLERGPSDTEFLRATSISVTPMFLYMYLFHTSAKLLHGTSFSDIA